MHLVLDCKTSSGHPQSIMNKLNIKYTHCIPSPINETWVFFNCKVNRQPLPDYFKELDIDPMDFVGMGLSIEDVKQINGDIC
jgi:hypothetical protein